MLERLLRSNMRAVTREHLGDFTLALNAGSSSLKFASYENRADGPWLAKRAAIEDIGGPASRLWIRDHDGDVVADRSVEAPSHPAALVLLLEAIDVGDRVGEVGHRVVFGGSNHRQPELVTDALLDDLDSMVDLDPLHLPPALAVLRSAQARLAGACHVACFDTAFHQTMPESAARYPLPDELWDLGIRRYGFHGLVAESVVEQLPNAGRLVIAHLGSGVSVTAVLDGRGMDTTMGFTPAGGVMMATRPGDLDPGVLVHLVEHLGYTPAQLRILISQQSGLLGVSGTTANMQDLLRAMPHDQRASRAVEMFCYQVRKAIGAMAAVLDGIDTLVFSGGIGERSPAIRSLISAPLGYSGVYLDEDRNAQNDPVISPHYRQVDVRVVGADEERLIARHARTTASATEANRTARTR